MVNIPEVLGFTSMLNIHLSQAAGSEPTTQLPFRLVTKAKVIVPFTALFGSLSDSSRRVFEKIPMCPAIRSCSPSDATLTYNNLNV